ncbi:MAG: cation:proton antiporter, partial [Myxococcota bacterium]
GLVVLAAVTGVIGARAEGEAYSPLSMGVTVAKALGFFGLAAAFGLVGSPRLFRIASRLRGRGLLLATALALCFGLAAAASLLGLAPIVGAFAAGLALDEAAYRDLLNEGDHRLETLLEPLTAFLVPFFFVLMGARVELAAFAQPGVLGFGIVLTLAAVAGKQVCGLGVLGGSANRLAVGLGMVPRGEVGLIFAAIGAKLVLDGRPVIDSATYTALVFMVFTTTLVTPAFLGRALARQPQPLARERGGP